ncbi:hypothetical protein C4K22_3587 [Pseudomonas chlororaphis subsp. aurantiaca]|nr:hypothetical protein C4K22_3587 [Pseudomonas chlororaphis subsp. aurantiaca]AZD42669.1 hypothetical protein C4K21_3595 [Pseudomonas chlororaphis subsp. aurantiaca]AZD48935.1 hypothetical protein C4K20_3520 [Pseudomonas chlororaphis subsp. aurantiaca]
MNDAPTSRDKDGNPGFVSGDGRSRPVDFGWGGMITGWSGAWVAYDEKSVDFSRTGWEGGGFAS